MCVSLMLILFTLSVMGDDFNPNSYTYWCNMSGYSVVVGKFGKEKHLLCLKMVPLEASHLTQVSRVYLDPEPNDMMAGVFKPGDVIMAAGFPLVEPSTGSAEGYIGQDGHFYGVLHLDNRTLYADPYNQDDPKKHFGPFEDGSFVSTTRSRRDHAQVISGFSKSPPSGPVKRTATARICDLLLLADKEFYEKDAHSSLTHAVSRMVHAVAQADVIFRNADFDEDGMPDNIGFSVKYILVLASKDTNARVFGDGQTSTLDGRSYLMRFSRLRRLGDVCLGIAFSGHSFQNRTLGLSFTSLGGGLGSAAGGVCDRRAFGRSFNTLAIAHATGSDNERVPERIAALTLAHEIGHSFGAHHDDNFPNPMCRGFLMGAQSSTADNPTHFEFSLCSKRLIASTLNTMSYCLYDEERPYCGNGIVEEDEACDCGLPVRCISSDHCCTPRAGGAEHFEEGTLHKVGCAVAPAVACHPSQGPCCNTSCHYANLADHGIDCTRLGQECSCAQPSCRCGLGGRCLADGCHAAECAAQGLRECVCTPEGMSGELNERKMCGACCVLPDGTRERCVSAEIAARERRVTHTDWLHDDYTGPNLTIQLCKNCTATMIRAWPVGGYCVVQNAVGMCSTTGICVAALSPRINDFPETMVQRFKLASLKKSSSAVRLRIQISICFSVFTAIK